MSHPDCRARHASSIKAKVTQGGTALSTMSDAIGGSIANAITNVDTVKQRSVQTIQSAQTSVAQQPYNIAGARSSVDNAATALQNAQTNLDNAVVTAPSAGVVASIFNLPVAIVSGGLLCIAGVGVLAARVPQFARYDAKPDPVTRLSSSR